MRVCEGRWNKPDLMCMWEREEEREKEGWREKCYWIYKDNVGGKNKVENNLKPGGNETEIV